MRVNIRERKVSHLGVSRVSEVARDQVGELVGRPRSKPLRCTCKQNYQRELGECWQKCRLATLHQPDELVDGATHNDRYPELQNDGCN